MDKFGYLHGTTLRTAPCCISLKSSQQRNPRWAHRSPEATQTSGLTARQRSAARPRIHHLCQLGTAPLLQHHQQMYLLLNPDPPAKKSDHLAILLKPMYTKWVHWQTCRAAFMPQICIFSRRLGTTFTTGYCHRYCQCPVHITVLLTNSLRDNNTMADYQW